MIDAVEAQKEYEILLGNIKQIEAEIMPKLELLGQQIPEIYKGYAKIVRESVGTALNIINMKQSSANNIMLAAEIGARTMEAYGEWKAAREHNRMLNKFLVAKQNFAQLHLSQIEKSANESNANLKRVKMLFNQYTQQSYDLSCQDKATIDRLSNLLLRHLILYRTNLFISRLCAYLKAECTAWINGQQTSSQPRTDYYIVNGEILQSMFGKNTFGAIETAADSDGHLSGAQIMLLGDPQLSIYALKDTMCSINYMQASEPVRTLLYNNPAYKFYTGNINEITNKINKKSSIYFMAFAALAAVVCLCIWFVPAPWWRQLLIGVIASSGIYRITAVNGKKLKIFHATESMEVIARIDDAIESYCGKVQEPQIDYNKKDALSISLKAFFR